MCVSYTHISLFWVAGGIRISRIGSRLQPLIHHIAKLTSITCEVYSQEVGNLRHLLLNVYNDI